MIIGRHRGEDVIVCNKRGRNEGEVNDRGGAGVREVGGISDGLL